MAFTVELRYALLEDGTRFLFDPTAEAQPTHVDGKRVTGWATGPSVEVEDVESDSTRGDWRKIRAAVNKVLAAERPDVASAAAEAPPEEPEPPAPPATVVHPWSGV